MDQTLPPITPDPTHEEPAPSNWPTWFGVISIVFGALLLLGSCCGSIWMLMAPSVMARMAGMEMPEVPAVMKWVTVLDMPVSLVLGALLIFGGIRLLRRRQSGRTLLMRYAVIRIVLAVPLLAAGFLMLQPSVEWGAAIARSQIDLMHKQSPNAKVPPQLEAAANQDKPGMLNYLTLFGGSALGLAFPIAIVLWMGGGPVKEEVAGWEP
jgi:uncharacterized protein YceK